MNKKKGRPKSLDKRNQIQNAAIELFLTEGYDRTSMQKIADKAGVSKQTLYSHFNDKGDLFRVCVVGWTDTRAVEYEKYINLDLLTGLKEMSAKYFQAIERPDVIRLWRLMIASAESQPQLPQMFFDNGMVVTRNMFTKFMALHSDEFSEQHSEQELWDIANEYLSILCADRMHTYLLGIAPEFSEEQDNLQIEKSLEKFKKLYLKA